VTVQKGQRLHELGSLIQRENSQQVCDDLNIYENTLQVNWLGDARVAT
jgi:hypothetical protein